jgi:hypothetical protein
MDVGEEWAYRARAVDPLVAVTVLKVGVQRPPRVLIRFLDASFEGREEWVPTARLKVAWSDVDSYTAREAKWNVVRDASPIREDAADYAASAVFDHLIPDEMATVGYGSDSGVTQIHDVAGLAHLLELDNEESLRSDPSSFVDGEAFVVPWAITEFIAKRAARRDPSPLLRHVDVEEAEHERNATYGKDMPASRHFPEMHIEADYYAESDSAPYGRPYRDLLREWCGADAVERRDELTALRAEVHRLGLLLNSAVAALNRAGDSHTAIRLERDLGVPASEIQAETGGHDMGTASGSSGG